MISLIARPTHQVGHHGKRQRRRKIGHTVDLGLAQRGVDDARRLLVHTVADSPQRPRQYAVRHEFAPLIMFCAITVQCCAAGQSVGDGVERHSATGDERRIIAQHGLAFAESRQRIDPVPR